MAFHEGLDDDALHRYFWDRRDHNNRVMIHATRMGEYLGVTRFTVMRHIKVLCEAGQLTRVRRTSTGVIIYTVSEPQAATAAPAPEPEPKRKVIRWG